MLNRQTATAIRWHHVESARLKQRIEAGHNLMFQVRSRKSFLIIHKMMTTRLQIAIKYSFICPLIIRIPNSPHSGQELCHDV